MDGRLDAAALEQLRLLRSMYEPYVESLAEHLLMPLPVWAAAERGGDNWRTSAWERGGQGGAAGPRDVHDDE